MRKRMLSGWGLLWATFFALMLTACGGGGGGGASPSLDDQAFTGVRTQATFDLTNAEDLVLGAFEGEGVGGIAPLSVPEAGLYQVKMLPFDLPAIARRAVELAQATLPQVQPSALLNPAEECLNYPAGTLTDSLVPSGNPSVLTVGGTVTYNNCDIGGLILTGPETVSVTFNALTGDSSLSLVLHGLHADDGVETLTLAGTIAGTFTMDQGTGYPASELTMNVTLTDAANKTFWLKNYQLNEWEEATGVRGLWSGRFYHHDHGFVDFTTDPANPIFAPFDPFSSTFDGKLDITGASQSRATLWLGVNAADYCINVFGTNGSYLGDLGTCAL